MHKPILALSALLASIALMQFGVTDSPSPEPVRLQWEYRIIQDAAGVKEGALNHFGAEGWELCAADHESGLIFKRPKADKVREQAEEVLRNPQE